LTSPSISSTNAELDPQLGPDQTAPNTRRRLTVLILCLLAGPLIAEGLMRFLLFDSSALVRDLAGDLRDAGRFADPFTEDEYWLLHWKLNEDERKYLSPPYDEKVGWVKHGMEPGTYTYEPAFPIGERRPVLMYGASYVQGFGETEERFEGLMESSEAASNHSLVNLGVGGYGIGQVYLLLRESIDLYTDRKPVVVIGVVADSDFDRSVLRFRVWPKARVEIDGQGNLTSEDVPPGGPGGYVEEHGTGIVSYVWRYLLHSPSQVPGSWQDSLTGAAEKAQATQELANATVLGIQDELERRELDYFFLLCTSPHSLPPNEMSPMEGQLLEVFEGNNVPYVRVRDYLLSAERASGNGLEPFFIQSGVGIHHPTPLGNEIHFEAILDGLRGRFGASPAGPVLEDGIDEGSDDGSRLEHNEDNGSR
jgi:hypothetical protein